MAISVLQEASNQAASSVSSIIVTLGVAVTQGSSIHLIVMYQTGESITSITDGVNHYKRIGSVVSDLFSMAQYVANNCAAGITNITINQVAASTQLLGAAREIGGTLGVDLTGTGTTAGQEQTNPGSGANAVSTGNMTPSFQPGLISAAAFSEDSMSAAGTGFTFGANTALTNLGGSILTESQRYTSLSAIAATFTKSAGTLNTTSVGALFVEGNIAPRTTLVSDNITNAVTEDINTYNANWVYAQQPATNIQVISTGCRGNFTSLDGAAYRQDIVTPNDQFAQATVVSTTTNYGGVCVRAATGGNCYFAIAATGFYEVGKFVAGTETFLKSATAWAFAAGDILTLTIQGTTLTFLVNGGILYQTTDASLSSGQAGVTFHANTTTILNTWSAGGFSFVSPGRCIYILP